MEPTGQIGQSTIPRREKMFSFGLLVLGVLLVSLAVVAMTGCKGTPQGESKPDKAGMSIEAYWESLFKDDPESQAEFKRIQADFRTGKLTLAIGELQELVKRSPEAPWAEAAEFLLAQGWALLQKHGRALSQFDLFLTRYPNSPAVPRALIGKGQIFLAMGKQLTAAEPEDSAGGEYLEKARDLFQEVQKKYSADTAVAAEAGYSLGSVYEALRDTPHTADAFRKVAEMYPDTSYAAKSLYSLAGVLLGEVDVEGAARVFREITERYPKTQLAEKSEKKLEGIRLVGSEAPALRVKEWIGEPPPAEKGYAGKITLLSFWAIWCPHCRRNIPKIEGLLETYGKRGVSVVGITREREGYGIDEVKEFVERHPMTYPTGVDDGGKMSEEMAVASIPCVVVVDARGRICWHGHPDYLSPEVIEVLLQRST